MKTTLRWAGGLVFVLLMVRGSVRLVAEVGHQDWADAAFGIVALVFIVWVFDTFRQNGPMTTRRVRA